MFQKWLQEALNKGITDAEIYSVRNKSVKLNVFDQKLEQHVQSDVNKVTIRGIYQGKQSTVNLENLNDESVYEALDSLIENAKNLTVVEPAIIYEGSESYPEVKENLFDFNSVPTIEKINLIKNIESTILKNEKTKTVQSTVYSETQTETRIVNTKGLDLQRKANFAYAYSIGVFNEGDDVVTGMDIKIAKDFSEFNALEIANKVIDKGVKKLGGTTINTGSYETVFANDMFSELLSVFSNVFSGEAAYRNQTPLKDKKDQKVFGSNINIINAPLHEKAYFQIPFDDEGVACKTRSIIKDGVFTGFNHNLKTAKIFNEEPTGNGFSGGISPANLYLKPGNLDFDSLIKPIKDGVYITDLVGLHAGIKVVSGEFSLQAGGFKITNGKLDYPVKMIVLSGNFYDLLNNVVNIGSDFEFDSSGIGSASVHVNSLMIAGK